MVIMDINNHTKWSDGAFNVEQIVKNGIDHGVQIIGICDYFETNKCKSISRDDIKNYIEDIKQIAKKYEDKISVKIGVEMCMNTINSDLSDIPYDLLNQLDFVLFEAVEYTEVDYLCDEYNKYSIKLKDLKKYTSNFTCKIGLAHKDLFKLGLVYGSKDKDKGLKKALDLIKENNMFWELNVNNKYSVLKFIIDNLETTKMNNFFKSIAEREIKIAIGTDTKNFKYYKEEDIKVANEITEEYKLQF